MPIENARRKRKKGTRHAPRGGGPFDRKVGVPKDLLIRDWSAHAEDDLRNGRGQAAARSA
jgi:hypothetical protein